MTPFWRCATLAALAATSSLAVAQAQPSAAPRGPTSCFHVKQMSHLRSGGPRTLYARVGTGVLRLELANDCPDVAVYGGVLVVEPTPSGSVCGPAELRIDLNNHGGITRCIVGDIVRLNPEEAAALPKRSRP